MRADRQSFLTYLADRYPMMTEREADGLISAAEHLGQMLSIPDVQAGMRAWFRVQAAVAFKHSLTTESPADLGRAKVLNEVTTEMAKLVAEVRGHEKQFLAPPARPADFAALIHEEQRHNG